MQFLLYYGTYYIRKLGIILLVIVFCLSISQSSAFAAEPKQEVINEIPYKQIEDAMLKQKDAISAHALFLNSFSVGGDGQYHYPDEYGGEYIDDNGNLICSLLLMILANMSI